jgi:cytidylate kinase
VAGAGNVIVTIDGPAGAGKSSIARQVADRLGFEFLDTGAMYRAITLGAIRNQVEFDDPTTVIGFAQKARLRWEDHRLFLDDTDVTEEIRSPIVTDSIRFVADLPEIRSLLSQRQREIARGRNIVTEGRDQGSEVFPDAECKIFLTASPEERAKRRHQQLADNGRPIPLDEILRAQNRRDEEDRNRPMGSLRPADDAVVLQSDGLTTEEVLERTLEIVGKVIEANQVNDCS